MTSYRRPPLLHALHEGWTLCGLSPWEGWPEGDLWRHLEDLLASDWLWPPATPCPSCQRMALEKRPPGDTPPKEP